MSPDGPGIRPAAEVQRAEGATAGLEEPPSMDHRIPTRRVPVTYWTVDQGQAHGQIFLGLDPTGDRHQTVLARLNSPSRFIPMASSPDGRIELINRTRLLRLAPGPEIGRAHV